MSNRATVFKERGAWAVFCGGGTLGVFEAI